MAKERRCQVEKSCRGGCDRSPEELETQQGDRELPRSRKLLAYMVPQACHWNDLIDDILGFAGWNAAALLPQIDWSSLSVVDFKVDYATRRGGRASVTSRQKQSLVRGVWNAGDVEAALPGEGERRAFAWLMANNETYKKWVLHHKALLAAAPPGDDSWRYVRTAQLLLQSPGLEVAARPWMYPRSSFADTDLKERLHALGVVHPTAKPSTRTSFHRKLRSRCADYAADFPLVCYLHDVALAGQISGVVHTAARMRLAPDELAADMNNFEAYWLHQTQRLEDLCRQMDSLPNLFFTIAPAEWSFPLPYGVLQAAADAGALSENQALLTLHLHNALSAVLEHSLLKTGANLEECGIKKVKEYVFRFEFQSRGTLHVHVLAWVDYLDGQNVDLLTGNSNTAGPKSPFVAFLERTFRCGAVDVQCTRAHTTRPLLQYVLGYTAKASDALRFHRREAQGQGDQQQPSLWAQIYRLMCKRQPLEQEISMEFACLPLVKASFTGADCYAPVPGSTAVNNSRHEYLAFQQCLRGNHKSIYVEKAEPDNEGGEEEAPTEDEVLQPSGGSNTAPEVEAAANRTKRSFLEWHRKWKVATKLEVPGEPGHYSYTVAERNLAGGYASSRGVEQFLFTCAP